MSAIPTPVSDTLVVSSPVPSAPAYPVVGADVEQSPKIAQFERLFPFLLIGFTVFVVTIFSAYFMMSNRINDLRTWLALALTDTFVVCTLTTLALIIAAGTKQMNFEEGFLKWLGGATIAEVAGIVLIVFRFFFANAGSGSVIPK